MEKRKSDLSKMPLNIIKNNIKKIEDIPKKCSICNDKEVVYDLDNKGMPTNIRPCSCVQQGWYRGIIEKSGLGRKLEECTFENFNADNDNLKYAKTLAMQFVSDDTSEALLFLGKSGTGKTHLATAVAGKLLNEQKKPLIYVRYRELVQPLKAMTFDLEERAKYINKYKTISYLYIDDLFKNMDSRNYSEKQYIFEILDYRYSNHKKTIITSEYTISQLLQEDEAMMGRLGEMARGYIVEFNKVDNYRAKKMQEDRSKQYTKFTENLQ